MPFDKYIDIFFAVKLGVAFAVQKLSTLIFFSKKNTSVIDAKFIKTFNKLTI